MSECLQWKRPVKRLFSTDMSPLINISKSRFTQKWKIQSVPTPHCADRKSSEFCSPQTQQSYYSRKKNSILSFFFFFYLRGLSYHIMWMVVDGMWQPVWRAQHQKWGMKVSFELDWWDVCLHTAYEPRNTLPYRLPETDRIQNCPAKVLGTGIRSYFFLNPSHRLHL